MLTWWLPGCKNTLISAGYRISVMSVILGQHSKHGGCMVKLQLPVRSQALFCGTCNVIFGNHSVRNSP